MKSFASVDIEILKKNPAWDVVKKDAQSCDRIIMGRNRDTKPYLAAYKAGNYRLSYEKDAQWMVSCPKKIDIIWTPEWNMAYWMAGITSGLQFHLVTKLDPIIKRAYEEKDDAARMNKRGPGGVFPELLMLIDNGYTFKKTEGRIVAYPPETAVTPCVINNYFEVSARPVVFNNLHPLCRRILNSVNPRVDSKSPGSKMSDRSSDAPSKARSADTRGRSVDTGFNGNWRGATLDDKFSGLTLSSRSAPRSLASSPKLPLSPDDSSAGRPARTRFFSSKGSAAQNDQKALLTGNPLSTGNPRVGLKTRTALSDQPTEKGKTLASRSSATRSPATSSPKRPFTLLPPPGYDGAKLKQDGDDVRKGLTVTS